MFCKFQKDEVVDSGNGEMETINAGSIQVLQYEAVKDLVMQGDVLLI